jgi:hypothetical protein
VPGLRRGTALMPTKYDYANASRGYWALMRDTSGKWTVILTEYPGTLLSMYRNGHLIGKALEDAEALVAHETDRGSNHPDNIPPIPGSPESTVRADVGPTSVREPDQRFNPQRTVEGG